MTKCKECCETQREYKRQFPTTLYDGKCCTRCGKDLGIKLKVKKGI